MVFYIAKRLLLMIPLILGIMFITFLVIQLAPGEPVEVETEISMLIIFSVTISIGLIAATQQYSPRTQLLSPCSKWFVCP